MNDKYFKLKRANSPEEVGVDSLRVRDFLKELDDLNLNMHSMMIIKNGEVATECYWHPYKAEIPMSMFSFSKGITGTAIGIAIGEGLLSPGDKVSTYFPFTCKNDEDQRRYDSMTIYDLITHRSGKKIPVLYDSEVNRWDEYWLNAPFACDPGKKFQYVSENTYMLSKLITKLTGLTLTQYLTPRLFEPLGIKTPFWEPDHDGADAGGWGAFLTLEDIAKVGQCYLQNGIWEGKQLIPEDWIKDATFPHVKKIPSIFQKNTGYGYQIFVQPERHTYSFNGLYGQFVVVYPEFNAVFACTSGECDEYNFIHTLNKYLPSAFSGEPLPKSGGAAELASYIYATENPVLPWAVRNQAAEAALKNKVLTINDSHPYIGIIGPSTTFMQSAKSGELNGCTFDFEGDVLTFSFSEKNSPNQTISVGMGNKYLYSKVTLAGTEYNIAAIGTWNKKDELVLKMIPLESAQERIFTFSFNKNNVKIKAETNPDFYSLFKFYLMFNGVNPSPPLKAAAKAFGVYADHMFNPNFKGTLADTE